MLIAARNTLSSAPTAKLRKYAEYYLRTADGTITEIHDDITKRIRNYLFQGCSSLVTADFPLVTSIGVAAFQSCLSLVTADIPLVTSIRNYAFQSCSSLFTIGFPLVTSVGNAAFQSCSSLVTAKLSFVTSVGGAAFHDCSKLAALVMDKITAVPTLAHINSFTNTPTTMKIVVPDSLVDSMKTATKWSTYADRIIGVSEYENSNGNDQ